MCYLNLSVPCKCVLNSISSLKKIIFYPKKANAIQRQMTARDYYFQMQTEFTYCELQKQNVNKSFVYNKTGYANSLILSSSA